MEKFFPFIQITGSSLFVGYSLLFLGMLVDAPSFTIGGSFLSAIGYFNIYAIFFLSLFAEAVADAIYYSLGYAGRRAIIEKYGRYVGLSAEKIATIERLLHENSFKALVVLKLTPLISIPGIIMVGATKMPVRRFASIIAMIAVPRSIVFAVVGYHFGVAYQTLTRYAAYGQYYLVVFILLLVIVYAIYKRFTRRISKEFINGKPER